MLKKISLSILFSLIPLTHVYAFHFPSANVDRCAHVEGDWTGTGVVSTKIRGSKIVCEYNGKAIVHKTATAYQADVTLKRKSGNACPQDEQYSVPGTCDGATGVILLQDEDTHLKGQLSSTNTHADFTGTVTVPIFDKKLLATVEKMSLDKV